MTPAVSSKIQIEIPPPKEATKQKRENPDVELTPDALTQSQIEKIKKSIHLHPSAQFEWYRHRIDAADQEEHYYIDVTGFPLYGPAHMRNCIQVFKGVTTLLLSRELKPLEYEASALNCLSIAVEERIAPPTFLLKSKTGEVILFQNYLQGHSLPQMIGWIDYKIKVNEIMQKNIMDQLLRIFAFLHENEISLRALTPNDIFFQKKEFQEFRMYLLNFSYATDSTDQSTGIFGSPLYAPPEAQTKSSYCPQKADLFILGLNFYYLISGDNLNIQISEEFGGEELQKAIYCIINRIPQKKFQCILKGLLQVNPDERLSASATLELLPD